MRLGYIFGLSLQTEVLVLAFFGIMHTIFDTSLLEFNTNMVKIWNVPTDPHLFSEGAEQTMKYILAGIVMVRTFTIHIYLGTYIIMLYPLIFEDRPGLMIPWIVIHVVKCLACNLVAFMVAFYVCFIYYWAKPTCWEFVLSNVTYYYIPSIYMFCLVWSFRQNLKKLLKIHQYIDPHEIKKRHRRARLREAANSRGYKTHCKSLDRVMLQLHSNNSHRWRRANVTAPSQPETDVMGQTFPISNTILDAPAKAYSNRTRSAQEVEEEAMEEIQKISNLDSHTPTDETGAVEIDETKCPTKESAKRKSKRSTDTEFSTVSDLLNDPDIALVLNMITGKDEPWETDMSKIENYEITITEESPMWNYPIYCDQSTSMRQFTKRPRKERENKPKVIRTKKRDASYQVSSPHFSETMDKLPHPTKTDSSFSSNQSSPRKMAQASSQVVDIPIPVQPQLDVVQPSTSKQTRTYYGAYPKTFKNDGYTQAFIDKKNQEMQ